MAPIEYLSAHPSKHRGKKPTYSTKCIGEFSLNADSSLVLGRAQLKYVYEDIVKQKLKIDLTDGINRQVEKWRTESLDKIFRWLMATNASGTSLKEALEGCEFVSRRGPLSRIAYAPYSSTSLNDDHQKLSCAKYKGVIFIREYNKKVDGEDDKSEWNDFQHKAFYSGRKFEQLVTVDEPNGGPPDGTVSVDPNPEFNGVFNSILTVGGHPIRMLCAGEIDAVRASDGKFVELKTQFKYMGCGRNFSSKALKWYLQSYLIGINDLVVGCHEEFMLNLVEYYPLSFLRDSCVKARMDPELCLKFLHTFLETVKKELDALPEGTLLVVERLKGSDQFTFAAVNANDKEAQAEYAVISDEFQKHNWTP